MGSLRRSRFGLLFTKYIKVLQTIGPDELSTAADPSGHAGAGSRELIEEAHGELSRRVISCPEEVGVDGLPKSDKVQACSFEADRDAGPTEVPRVLGYTWDAPEAWGLRAERCWERTWREGRGEHILTTFCLIILTSL